MDRKETDMASKTKDTITELVEDPAKLVKEETEPAKQQTVDPRDKEIAELRAKLAKAEQMNKAMSKGDDFAIVQQAAADAAKNGKDPFMIDVSIRVPVRSDCSDKYYWICVNGRSAQIPADNSYQTMKLPFAEALLNKLKAEKHAASFADELQVYDPVTNPHPDPNK